ncbi:MAG: hypothetical protein HY473_00945 [Candidatus Sungbacteria bacterium]|uniref:Uncharacterized protein n=1 Tax=Candidatus Sungiibacteriota bacterium TaxID=2750080 RepID=A0A932YYS3_9BACT|nr:hypothetical protein [Candidatus Sungbacteria bacterium]
MFSHYRFGAVAAVIVLFAAGIFATVAYANHSWDNYHWARTANPFTLKLGDNVSTTWDVYLSTASSDWSQSSVLNTTVVAGGTRARNCRPTAGRIEVCNYRYGNNGWLGLAQIWVNSSSHITQAVAKMNDTYFNTATYNTPAWRRLVVCQEIAHGFGLDHQDENFSNPNLGSCMDYTNDPDGPPSNEHPNQHDYDQLETIYAHLDGATTVGQTAPRGNGNNGVENQAEWGKAIRTSSDGRPSLYARDLGGGEKVFTFVIWADAANGN